MKESSPWSISRLAINLHLIFDESPNLYILIWMVVFHVPFDSKSDALPAVCRSLDSNRTIRRKCCHPLSNNWKNCPSLSELERLLKGSFLRYNQRPPARGTCIVDVYLLVPISIHCVSDQGRRLYFSEFGGLPEGKEHAIVCHRETGQGFEHSQWGVRSTIHRRDSL